jgi:hypothetical protein
MRSRTEPTVINAASTLCGFAAPTISLGDPWQRWSAYPWTGLVLEVRALLLIPAYWMLRWFPCFDLYRPLKEQAAPIFLRSESYFVWSRRYLDV